MKSTGESLDQQIADIYERHQAEPQNVDLARKLGALNEENGDVESAIAWYQYTVDLTSGTDAGLTRRVSDLKMRRSDEAITELETFLAAHGPDHELYAERAEQLATARKSRDALLVEDARKRLERNPTDLQLRFELGELLVKAGQFRDALPELQRARQNPNARLKAMNLLGRCYRELGMMDLAMKQLEEASREIGSMDAMKKEIVYSLGLVYEKMGDREKSLSCMKQIYEADYGYKDVAERVESSYRESAPPA
jgi:tetratricopeptide (TPR) repeat protein